LLSVECSLLSSHPLTNDLGLGIDEDRRLMAGLVFPTHWK
jgi:hypothetical protein